MKYNAFDGRVVFTTRHNSLGTRIQADRLDKAFADGNPDVYALFGEVFRYFAIMLSATESITFAFTGDEAPMLTDFEAFWVAYEQADPSRQAELAFNWRLETNDHITDVWLDAVLAAQNPFRDPTTLPGTLLTQDEKAQAANPDSPLVKRGKKNAALPVTLSEAS